MGPNEQRDQAQSRNDREGDRISANIEGRDMNVTINPTSDPRYEGQNATYVSVTDAETGVKNDATMVVDGDGNILNDNPSSSWHTPS